MTDENEALPAKVQCERKTAHDLARLRRNQTLRQLKVSREAREEVDRASRLRAFV
jgi:hypothetical protein